jgi:hypothetical protein
MMTVSIDQIQLVFHLKYKYLYFLCFQCYILRPKSHSCLLSRLSPCLSPSSASAPSVSMATVEKKSKKIAIIGAGFGGIAMAIELKKAGEDDFLILEKGGDVGGVWRDNTYPGCSCDVPSHLDYAAGETPCVGR